MENEKNNPIGYKTVTYMEEERQHVEETESRSTEEQAAREHFEKGS